MPKPPIPRSQIDKIIRFSDGVRTRKEIARLVGQSEETVRKYQLLNGCKRQTRTGMRRGPGHPNWNSGRRLDRDGYVLISCGPEHPHIRKQTNRIVGIIAEHRIMAEIKLGRLLKRTEVVDHIDGCKLHNDPDNLRVYPSNAAHLKATITGQVPKWSDSGRVKFQMARHRREEMNRKFPEQIDTHNQRKRSGVLRLQQIRLAHELLGGQSIWFLGMSRYFEQAGIDWPFDQKTEGRLKKKYLRTILHHPKLKLWIEG